MKKIIVVSLILVTVVAVLAACQGQTPGASVPDEYAGITNPLDATTENIQAGRTIYENRCAGCHGENALGQGEAASSMEPTPSDLIYAVGNQNDDYIFWRIATGTEDLEIDSSMPAFASVLSENEIWQVITFLEDLNRTE